LAIAATADCIVHLNKNTKGKIKEQVENFHPKSIAILTFRRYYVIT